MSQVIDYIYNLILCYGWIGLTLYFTSLFLTKKVASPTFEYVYWASFTPISILVYFVLHSPLDLLVIGYSSVYTLCFFYEKFRFKGLILFHEVFYLYFVEIIFSAFFALITQNTYNYLIQSQSQLYQACVNGLAYFLVLVYYGLSLKKVVPTRLRLDTIKPTSLAIIWIVTLITFIFTCMLDLSLNHMKLIELSISSTFIFVSIIMVILILIGGTVLVSKIATNSVLSHENAMIEKQLQAQLSHYHQLEKSMLETRKIKHDMRNHLITMRHLMQEGHYDQVNQFIDALDVRIQSASSDIVTGNDIFDAILYEKFRLANENNIQIDFKGHLPSDIGIQAVDLCTIISNSIDNALEACLRLSPQDRRWISISSHVLHQQWLFEVKNASLPVNIPIGGFPKSKKPGEKNHGLGLVNIRDSVQKYDGTFEIGYTGNAFELNTVIQLLEHPYPHS